MEIPSMPSQFKSWAERKNKTQRTFKKMVFFTTEEFIENVCGKVDKWIQMARVGVQAQREYTNARLSGSVGFLASIQQKNTHLP
jgi:hypothetical protein